MKKILVIDDDTYICNLLVNYLKQKGYACEGAFSGTAGKKIIGKEDFDVILCDYRLPDVNGYTILQLIKSKKPSVPVIIMTAYAEVKMAVKLIKSGAFDYVTKPVQPDEIVQLINKATESKNKNETELSIEKDLVVGKSAKILEVMQHISVVAPTDLTVLIEGETGSGKEYIARSIHQASKRKSKPFVAIDCGAIPKELANSELFGHIKGSFTGAVSDKKGVFEQAGGGTLFLDEVENLPYENQVKLLRTLQEMVINRVGDSKSIPVNVRLIAASNNDLLKRVKNNEFREDLYHRLNGFRLHLPPLRERKEDIMEFALFFMKKANGSFSKNVTAIDDQTRELLIQYQWFGNIRELQNIINRAVLLSRSETITPDVLPDEIRFNTILTTNKKIYPDWPASEVPNLKDATLITEKEVISNALVKANFNKSKAAKILNIDRKTLYNKIRLYDIDVIK